MKFLVLGFGRPALIELLLISALNSRWGGLVAVLFLGVQVAQTRQYLSYIL